MNLITKFKFMNVYSRHFTADLIRYVVSDMAVLASLGCVNVIWSKWGISYQSKCIIVTCRSLQSSEL